MDAIPVLSQSGEEALRREREQALRAWLVDAGSVLIGFSGGVDSAFLSCAAVEVLGVDRVLCVIGRSASYPESQWEMARAVAAQFNLPVHEVATHEMEDAAYAANPTNRCYFCKRELWRELVPIARERGYDTVVDGTNADDLHEHRPGAQAAKEAGVLSPLAIVGLTKEQIRALSAARGIPTLSQPSSPCLSSRIPYHTQVTSARLQRIERAEAAVRALGVAGDMRVRYHGALARVELAAGEIDQFLQPERSAELRRAVLGAGFERVALDLVGFRSGSLNVLAGVT
jgi:uncharacterized protein